MSRLGAIETSAKAKLDTISGFAETRAVAAGLLMNGRPDQYPAGWFSIISMKRVSVNPPAAGHTTYQFEVESAVLVFGPSDGVTLGDARTTAWALVDAVMDGFTGLVATGVDATVGPMRLDDPQNVITDTGLAAIYVPMTCSLWWTI